MSENLDRLRTAADQLQHAYERAYEENAESVARYGGGSKELGRMTRDGRWTLLDALTEIVHARTVIAQAELAQARKDG